MNFIKRLRTFVIGVALGTVLVFVLFKDKTPLFTSWLPENRVLQEIKDCKFQLSDAAKCKLACIQVADTAAVTWLTDSTEVDFSKSNTHGNPREYFLVKHGKTGLITSTVLIKDSTATLQEITLQTNCGC